MKREKLDRLGEILQESVNKHEIAVGNLLVMHHGEEIYYAPGRHGRYCTGKRHRKRQPIQIVFHVKAGNVSSSHVINGEGNC